MICFTQEYGLQYEDWRTSPGQAAAAVAARLVNYAQDLGSLDDTSALVMLLHWE